MIFNKVLRLLPSLAILAAIGVGAARALGANAQDTPVIAVVPGIVLFVLSRVVLWMRVPSEEETREMQRQISGASLFFIKVTAAVMLICTVSTISAASYAAMGFHTAASLTFRFAVAMLLIIPASAFIVFCFATVTRQYRSWRKSIPALKPLLACALLSIFMVPTVIADHSTWVHKG